MINVVVPIHDGDDPELALAEAIELHRHGTVRLHLLNVQTPLPRHVSRFFSGRDLRDFHYENGVRALALAMRMLDDAGIPHVDHVLVGRRAETIVSFAAELESSRIMLGDWTDGLLASLGLGSTGSQVRHLMGIGASEGPTAR